MIRKPTISIGDLDRPFVVTDRLLAAYAEMATDNDREAEAEQWLGAAYVRKRNLPIAEVICCTRS